MPQTKGVGTVDHRRPVPARGHYFWLPLICLLFCLFLCFIFTHFSIYLAYACSRVRTGDNRHNASNDLSTISVVYVTDLACSNKRLKRGGETDHPGLVSLPTLIFEVSFFFFFFLTRFTAGSKYIVVCRLGWLLLRIALVMFTVMAMAEGSWVSVSELGFNLTSEHETIVAS